MAAAQKRLLLVRNASQVVQVCSNREERLVGAAMKEIAILNSEGTEGLSVAVGADGNILCLGRDSEVARALEGSVFEEVIDARGSSVVPGLVDAHTHPVWVGDRVHEFSMKVATFYPSTLQPSCTYQTLHPPPPPKKQNK